MIPPSALQDFKIRTLDALPLSHVLPPPPDLLFPARTASPASKRQRLGGDDYTHASYGSRHDEDCHVSTFAINYDDDGDFEDDRDADDEAASPDGTGGGGASSGGAVVRKSRNKPWKLHRRVAGGSMHDANLYRHYRPDFRELAREYPGKSFGVRRRQQELMSFFCSVASMNKHELHRTLFGVMHRTVARQVESIRTPFTIHALLTLGSAERGFRLCGGTDPRSVGFA